MTRREITGERAPPVSCDICAQALPTTNGDLAVCSNCRTRYVKFKKSVKVQTAYEHKFQSTYLELSGRRSSVDITRLREKRAESGFGFMERIDFEGHRVPEEGVESQSVTIMLFPGDRMLARDGQLFLFYRQRVESVPLSGTIVDHGVLGNDQITELKEAGVTIRSVVKPVESTPKKKVDYFLGPLVEEKRAIDPNFPRIFALAMANSAIHATEHLVHSQIYSRVSPTR